MKKDVLKDLRELYGETDKDEMEEIIAKIKAEKERDAKARGFNRMYNEGYEGYNPYR